MHRPSHAAGAPRQSFPRGLCQPEGSFRFSADALLLASFLALPQGREQGSLVDLGAGCGVVACAMLLRHPLAQAVAVERQRPLALAAVENGRRLGLASRMRVLEGDLRILCRGKEKTGAPPPVPRQEKEDALHGMKGQQGDALSGVGIQEGACDDGVFSLHAARVALANSCDLALANPPYRVWGSGRLPREGARQEAFFGEADALDVFCRAASFCLRDKGRLGVIFPAERLPDLCLAVQGAGLRVRRILPVQTVAWAAARFVLVEAQKGSRGAAELSAPLVLHAGRGAETGWTAEALAFCPWLGTHAESEAGRE